MCLLTGCCLPVGRQEGRRDLLPYFLICGYKKKIILFSFRKGDSVLPAGAAGNKAFIGK